MFSAFNEDLAPSLGHGTTDQPNHQMESVLNTAEPLVYHVSPQLASTASVSGRGRIGKACLKRSPPQDISFQYKSPTTLVILVG